MAKRATKPTPKPPTVYCSDCRHFVRDTDGISRRQGTGEYFMGICARGLCPDTERKQFADKPRQCNGYIHA